MGHIVIALAALLLVACGQGSVERTELGNAEVQLFAPTITFELADHPRLAEPAATAFARLNAATCLGLQTVAGGQHEVRMVPGDEVPNGRLAHTGGESWDNTVIRLNRSMRPAYLEKILMHEVWHVLARTNGHTGKGIARNGVGETIDEAMLAGICEVQDCLCFNPEL
jgi:hypothetical protein